MIFSFWMLKRELRRRPSLSVALWIPTFFVMILGSRPVSDWIERGGTNGSGFGSSPWDAAFFAVVFGASLVIATSRGVKWGKFLAANIPLMLIYAYFISSTIWSDDPMGSAKKIFKDFALLFVIGLIYSEKEPLQAMRAIFIRSACFLFPLSLVFDRWFPRFAREFSPNGTMQFSGVTGQKNTLGEMVFILCAVLLWDYFEMRESQVGKSFLSTVPWDQLILFLMGIFILVQSQSKTALVALFICIAFSIRIGWLTAKVRTVGFLFVLSTPFLLFFTNEFGDMIQPIVAALGRDMTFTGRTNIWSHITWENVNPIIGCGYWIFWAGPKGRAISDSIDWKIPNAHCGYIDLYLDGGICALFVLFCVLASYGFRLVKRGHGNRFQQVRLGMFSAAIVYNLSESSFLRMGLLWFTTLLMIVDFPRMKQTVKKFHRTNYGVAVESRRGNKAVPETVRPGVFQ
jgi:exopolysaccharide production protein ExoQ